MLDRRNLLDFGHEYSPALARNVKRSNLIVLGFLSDVGATFASHRVFDSCPARSWRSNSFWVFGIRKITEIVLNQI